jgi:hypothetical protein
MKLSFSKELFFSLKFLPYVACLSLLPCLASFYFLYAKQQKIAYLEEKVLFIQNKIERKKQTRLQEEKILSQIQKANANYLQDHLSSLSFLVPEQQKWKMFLAGLGSSPEIKEKFAFLENMDNKLLFLENTFQKSALFEEREFTQQKSIKINREDLKRLLSLIEGVEIGSYHPIQESPQILITSFSLEKTAFSEMQEDIYTVQMQILTRQKNP